ncbi:MAG TPA: response regulator [Burkholderiales bacterium]|nr:response regulator [Burkholderiales bacterium]
MKETRQAGARGAAGDDSAFASGRRHTIRRLRLALAAAVLVPVAAFLGVSAFLYRQSFAAAEQNADAAARIAQQHVSNLLGTNQMLLARMVDLAGTADDATLLERGLELHERLQQMARELPQVQLLLINGADSRPLALSAVYPPPRHLDYTDREWHIAHRNARGPSLYITERLTSRATGEPFFDMSLRRNLADGSFGGSVHASLRPEYLTAFFGQIAAAVPGLRVRVLRSDGRLLARFPGTPAEGEALARADPLSRSIATGQEDGRYEGTVAGGEAVIGAFRKLPAYPIYVSASIARARVFGDWATNVGLLALFVLPMTLALGWIGANALRRGLESMNQLEREIARRRQVESALAHAQKLEAMGRLTGGIAHDFNNVLMVVSASAHLLRRIVASAPGATQQLDTIDRAVTSAARLTRQLLAFSRRQALAPALVSLQERLPGLLEVLQPLLGSGVQIALEIAPDTRPVFVDAAELELAVINVAINAKDAMENERGRLHISTRNATSALAGTSGDAVVIEMSDTGRGIDPAIAERVLEPFFTTKPAGQGSGLGLAQVQAFCESAGGQVRIAPREGGGTRVSLILAAAEAHAESASVVREPRRDAFGSLDCDILLVEDNASVAKATQSLLRTFGCRVHRVASTHAALRSLEEQRADVVLSDVEMPGDEDGIALAAQLAGRRPPVPVVLITGYASRLDQARGQGFTVLSKPCPPEALREAIAKALTQKNLTTSKSGSENC